MSRRVLLVGAGEMAVQHYRVLRALGTHPIVIGRGSASSERFARATGTPVDARDLDAYLAANGSPEDAVVSVGVESLADVTIRTIVAGARRVLLEKPGALHGGELERVAEVAQRARAGVWLGYNRRFYSSTRLAKEIIAQDGRIVSCHFDFTEWSHQVAALDRPAEVKQRWLLANSSHVIDLVFHLIGTPVELHCSVAGALPWHASAATFAGHGCGSPLHGQPGAMFSYHANWTGPGRWMCEFVTEQHKLVFMPMEELRVMERGSVAVTKREPPDDFDTQFKPGLYLQARAFLAGHSASLCTVGEQLRHWRLYERIANYPS